MDERTRRALIAAASGVAGFCFGSMLMNRAMNCELKRRALLQYKAFRTIADKIQDPTAATQEVFETMNDELEFLMIAIQER